MTIDDKRNQKWQNKSLQSRHHRLFYLYHVIMKYSEWRWIHRYNQLNSDYWLLLYAYAQQKWQREPAHVQRVSWSQQKIKNFEEQEHGYQVDSEQMTRGIDILTLNWKRLKILTYCRIEDCKYRATVVRWQKCQLTVDHMTGAIDLLPHWRPNISSHCCKVDRKRRPIAI
jgi:hypothetical protein